MKFRGSLTLFFLDFFSQEFYTNSWGNFNSKARLVHLLLYELSLSLCGSSSERINHPKVFYLFITDQSGTYLFPLKILLFSRPIRLITIYTPPRDRGLSWTCSTFLVSGWGVRKGLLGKVSVLIYSRHFPFNPRRISYIGVHTLLSSVIRSYGDVLDETTMSIL